MNKVVLFNLYESIKERKVLEIKALVYVSEDNNYDLKNPYDIVFVFADDEYLTFSCCSDSVTIDIRNKKIQGFDMQDCGRAEVIDFSNIEPFSQVLNNTLSKMLIIHSEIDGKDIGCSLLFKNIEVSILNLGGELFYFTSLREDFIKSEKITYHELEQP